MRLKRVGYSTKIKRIRDFNREVNKKCKILTKKGIYVQSEGEKKIADWLYDNNIEFDYDKLIRFGEDEEDFNDSFDQPLWARPDFRIKGTNIIIEYWGVLNDPIEKKNRNLELNDIEETYIDEIERKRALYQQEEMILIEIFGSDLDELDKSLKHKIIYTKKE
ncbi:MAG: hypothetical protein NT001_07835 [Candidatus Woesearchaeota archaeon]|nr:hypothetical protein [Candidatus Woesearchaeota archaeon]